MILEEYWSVVVEIAGSKLLKKQKTCTSNYYITV